MNDKLIISPETTLLQALRRMDSTERKLLVICKENHFEGLISIGDIQRALLNKDSLSDTVEKHIRPDIIYSRASDDISVIKKIMLEQRIECMPVIDEYGELKNIIEWEEVISGKLKSKCRLDIPVVIMAGGKGQRLKPLTNLIPKPLIPISDKTIIEEIMDRFTDAGCHDFYISVNYKADIITEYLSNLNEAEYNLNFICESKPLGTAGSLYLLKDSLKHTFIVSNCDIIVDIDFSDLVEYHRSNQNIATIVSVFKSAEIPYGTIETKENGVVTSLTEKPNVTYQISSGLYVLEPSIFDYLEDNEFIHITDLLLKAIAAGEKVGAFPVSCGSWADMGNWREYLKLIGE